MKTEKEKTIKAFENDVQKEELCFADLVRNGKCTVADIDDYIAKWHHEYRGPLELHEYLGLTKAQYSKLVVPPHRLVIPVRGGKKGAMARKRIASALIKVAKEALEAEE